MRLQSINKIRPMKDLVVVEIIPKELAEDEVYMGDSQPGKFQVKLYNGIAESLGPNATEDLNCPNLNKGDAVIFSQFAGSYISTDDGKLHKIIRGYDIMATTTDLEKINEDTLSPTADRVLIKVQLRTIDESGLYFTDGQDPSLVDLSYGEIIKVGPTVLDNFKKGDLIAYEPYSGETIRKKGSFKESELRVLRSDDILFVNEGP